MRIQTKIDEMLEIIRYLLEEKIVFDLYPDYESDTYVLTISEYNELTENQINKLEQFGLKSQLYKVFPVSFYETD